MGNGNEPHAHVHARIAEHVSRDSGVDVSAEDVRQYLEGEKTLPANIGIGISQEAREYGIA